VVLSESRMKTHKKQRNVDRSIHCMLNKSEETARRPIIGAIITAKEAAVLTWLALDTKYSTFALGSDVRGN
jgi:hypothetical protein